MKTVIRLTVGIVLLASVGVAQDGQQQFASLGDLRLVNGGVIRDCRLGYRTFGKLNAEKSNAILFPTWFGGNTGSLAESFGPGKLVDSSKYFIVAADALGNGVSSSPSNSTAQPRMKFPEFTVRDMVNAEHQMLTKVLGINHLKAVMGISMGGMQTFQWMVSYPDFMDKVIPMVGSPRLAPYDLLIWQTNMDGIKGDPGWNGGEYQENPAKLVRAQLGTLLLTTPERYNEQNKREQLASWLEQSKKTPAFDANNYIRQAQAMMALDVSDVFGGSMERAAGAVKAKALVVVATHDHLVTPGPALQFAPLIHAEVLKLEGDCGHLATACEGQTLSAVISAFLEK
jgi:homoserine O-acetyltransferase